MNKTCNKCGREVGMLSPSAARPFRIISDYEITDDGVTKIDVVVCDEPAAKACRRLCTNHKKGKT